MVRAMVRMVRWALALGRPSREGGAAPREAGGWALGRIGGKEKARGLVCCLSLILLFICQNSK